MPEVRDFKLEIGGRGPKSGGRTHGRHYGFTLLELLVVMGIMTLLMSIGVAGFMGMRRGAEIRGAASLVQSTMMLARQQAVTKRRTVEVHFFKTTQANGIRVFEVIPNVTTNLVHGDVLLPPGVEFDPSPPNSIDFKPSGQAAGSGGTATIRLIEKAVGQGNKQQVAMLTVWNLTGATEVRWETVP